MIKICLLVASACVLVVAGLNASVWIGIIGIGLLALCWIIDLIECAIINTDSNNGKE